MALDLYPYQFEVLDSIRPGSILCGGVGSGKSRTALVYYFLKIGNGSLKINKQGVYKPMETPTPLYIITTARKRDTKEWEKELLPFRLGEGEVVVDSWNKIQDYVHVKDAFFIFDEQRVIGSGAWVKAFLKITKVNQWILLTATPGDTWLDYIPVFVANGYYKNRTEFLRKHVIFNRFVKYPKVEKFVHTHRLHFLRDQVLIKMDYKNKTRTHYKDVYTTYSQEQHDKVMKDRWNIFKDEPIPDAAQLVYILRRVVNSDVSKLASVGELLKKHPKLIVFYNFNYELDMLREYAQEIKYPYAEWNGHKHEPIPTTDQWLYLVQYTAGAEGWNCIETNALVFFSQNYSYRTTVQAAGRIDRVNTPYSDLYYYRLRTTAGIDNAISSTHKQKKDFNERSFIANLNPREKHAL